MYLHCFCVTSLGLFFPIKKCLFFLKSTPHAYIQALNIKSSNFLTSEAQQRHHQMNQDSCPSVQRVLMPFSHQPDLQGSIMSLPVP